MDMETERLAVEFNKELHPKDSMYTPRPGFSDTWQWEERGIELARVLSKNMLVKQILAERLQTQTNSVDCTDIYLCYNWSLKVEFILVRSTVETTSSHYTPQYGRDDNYFARTRRDYRYLGFSVEAFKLEQPALAGHL